MGGVSSLPHPRQRVTMGYDDLGDDEDPIGYEGEREEVYLTEEGG